MSWVGGKKALRDEIVSRFPLDYKRYIEVFGGGGWVLFHKNPGKDFEVFNDFNGNLVNLYRCVREHKEDLIDELEFMLNSRLDFEYMKYTLHSQAVLPDIRRAAYYYALIRYRCDLKKVITINFDRNKVKKFAASLNKQADTISAELDKCLVNTEVAFEPPFDVNDTFAEVLAWHTETVAADNA